MHLKLQGANMTKISFSQIISENRKANLITFFGIIFYNNFNGFELSKNNLG